MRPGLEVADKPACGYIHPALSLRRCIGIFDIGLSAKPEVRGGSSCSNRRLEILWNGCCRNTWRGGAILSLKETPPFLGLQKRHFYIGPYSTIFYDSRDDPGWLGWLSLAIIPMTMSFGVIFGCANDREPSCRLPLPRIPIIYRGSTLFTAELASNTARSSLGLVNDRLMIQKPSMLTPLFKHEVIDPFTVAKERQ